ncbi:ABC transporter CDR4 [Rhizoctonia solani AG-1 IA]|uniref:ABC transporter CDR4 n=1 Tax=Thanatephorus cucumeris (strain AG1-IA) TaxID=983506 RepID=L8X6A4_THACA|nr:ABC transporter CDR4 [Rhizoctonia solani AG-1 IA]
MESGKHAEPHHADSVPADYFDNEGCAALTRTLSQLSQTQNDAQGKPTGDHSSGLGTLVENGAEEEKFDFAERLRTALDRMDEEGIKHRELGVGFVDLTVRGLGATAKYQETVLSMLSPVQWMRNLNNLRHPPVKDILNGFTGTVKSGEMLLVLGSPGSGCSTFLKVMANQRQGYHQVLGDVSYDGMRPDHLAKHYRGDVGYSPEDDTHFPSLSVKNTLTVAAKMRTPQNRVYNTTRAEFIEGMVQTLATVFGLRHTFNTPVGNEAIRGVSGGEKKRVSIAEMMASRVRIGCWDNSTRGLDSSTALEFVRALRIATDVGRATTVVTIYQASESLYKLFDKVCVIYSGKQIYYGPADRARQYFIDMGWEPAPRQTTSDFLVAVTDPLARTPRAGWENRVPRTADEFVAYWSKSPEGQANHTEATRYLQTPEHDIAPKIQHYKESARAERAKTAHPKSSYTVSLAMQVRGIMLRRLQILRGDMAAQIVMNVVFMLQAVIMGSVFLKMPVATSAYFSRGGVLFFSVLFGALSGMDAAKFFIFLLFTFLMTLTMKAFFRALAASFARESTAQAVAGIGTLILVLYTGYTIPKPSMIGALKWLTYINPIRYGFEALIVNEFHGLKGECSHFVPSGPGYEGVSIQNQVCTTVGSVPGQTFVDGDAFAAASYDYHYKNLWMNLLLSLHSGIVIAFWIAFVSWFLAGTERAGHTSGGVTQLVFKQNAKIPSLDSPTSRSDTEKGSISPDAIAEKKQAEAHAAQNKLVKANAVFSWNHLNYDIDIGGGKKRRLLDDVSGFVAPGKMTALMGESGAGKTTLLNALAERVSMGVITGDRFVNGNPLPKDFAAQTGYVQQMDIHLESTTVREALMFSAQLRQPASIPMEEKSAYVEEVIKMCAMESYADAIVGIVGEGLNVEQRKRLTIGVELAAKPQLLLFLDEVSSPPTSGLDSQSAWAIIEFLRSLAEQGQAILCTIHQPSSELFQSFDRLLLLRKGGQTCYFGDLGENSSTLISYFERNGARKCQSDENPAEYMLDVIGDIDWHATWKAAPESSALEQELTKMHSQGRSNTEASSNEQPEYATGYMNQLSALLVRAFRHYSRNPIYIMSKIVLNVASGLFIGFTFFKANDSIQGSQNKLFAMFMCKPVSVTVFGKLMRTITQLPSPPHLSAISSRFSSSTLGISMRTARNRARCTPGPLWLLPALQSSLTIFLVLRFISCAGIGLLGILVWPIAPDIQYFMLLCIAFPLYYTTFSQAVAAMAPNVMIGGLLFSFFFSFTMNFNGVLQPYSQLIPFWKWMWVACQRHRKDGPHIQTIVPPSGQTCSSYMNQYITAAGGYLVNPDASSDCQFCPQSTTDTYLACIRSGDHLLRHLYVWPVCWCDPIVQQDRSVVKFLGTKLGSRAALQSRKVWLHFSLRALLRMCSNIRLVHDDFFVQ